MEDVGIYGKIVGSLSYSDYFEAQLKSQRRKCIGSLNSQQPSRRSHLKSHGILKYDVNVVDHKI